MNYDSRNANTAKDTMRKNNYYVLPLALTMCINKIDYAGNYDKYFMSE